MISQRPRLPICSDAQLNQAAFKNGRSWPKRRRGGDHTGRVRYCSCAYRSHVARIEDIVGFGNQLSPEAVPNAEYCSRIPHVHLINIPSARGITTNVKWALRGCSRIVYKISAGGDILNIASGKVSEQRELVSVCEPVPKCIRSVDA